MIKTKAQLEHKIGERIFHFLCDNDSPLHEVKEALSQFIGHVTNIENAAKEQQEAAEKKKAEEAGIPVIEPDSIETAQE